MATFDRIFRSRHGGVLFAVVRQATVYEVFRLDAGDWATEKVATFLLDDREITIAHARTLADRADR